MTEKSGLQRYKQLFEIKKRTLILLDLSAKLSSCRPKCDGRLAGDELIGNDDLNIVGWKLPIFM